MFVDSVITKQEAEMLRERCKDHLAALKNWTVTAVENSEYDRAKGLAKDVRVYQELYSKLNGLVMEAEKAEANGG